MKLELYVNAYCWDIGKPTQRSGAAVLLRMHDDEDRVAERVISHPTGNATKNLAEINAARIALASVKRKHRKEAEVEIYMPKAMTGYMIEKKQGVFEKNSNKYKEELAELRRWLSYYEQIVIKAFKKEPEAGRCLAEAKTCADNQKPKDTKTQKVNVED